MNINKTKTTTNSIIGIWHFVLKYKHNILYIFIFIRQTCSNIVVCPSMRVNVFMCVRNGLEDVNFLVVILLHS